MDVRVPQRMLPGLVPNQRAVALSARLQESVFDGFNKVRGFALTVRRENQEETLPVVVCNGPGHNCTAVAGIVIQDNEPPKFVLKAGEAFIGRSLRGEPYIKTGFIAGRWDKVGADPARIGLEEIAEEVGGTAVPGAFWPLGGKLVPTVPHESTEADCYFVSLLKLGGHASGDGGGMELVGRMGPVVMDIEPAFHAMDSGEVSAGGRVRVLYNRALDAIGYIPQLGKYVYDLPPLLQQRFSTLGLGAAHDPRPYAAKVAPPPPTAKNSQTAVMRINDGTFTQRQDIPLSDDATFLDTRAAHVIRDGNTVHQVGSDFPMQLLLLNYDRAKIGLYYIDAQRGPMIRMGAVERPQQAVKGLALDGERTYKDENVDFIRSDVPEIKLDRRRPARAQVEEALAQCGVQQKAEELGQRTGASTGWTDLYYHFYAVQVPPPQDKTGFVPLSDAIEMCRRGQGESPTEALCQRLAEKLRWIPSLRMTVEQASANVPGKNLVGMQPDVARPAATPRMIGAQPVATAPQPDPFAR